MNKVKKVALKETLNLNSLGIIGISSHNTDYRLSWALNYFLSLKFMRAENLEINHPHSPLQKSFSTFEYFDPTTGCLYRLIANRCAEGFLCKEFRNIDFFMVIEGEREPNCLTQLVCALKNVEVVHSAFAIDPASFGRKLLPALSTVAA